MKQKGGEEVAEKKIGHKEETKTTNEKFRTSAAAESARGRHAER